MQHDEVELTREVEAIQIPSGDPVTLDKGTSVIITQALGGTYTVAGPSGLARIQEKDIDALGIEPPEEPAPSREPGEDGKPSGSLTDQVWAQLKDVYDPEIPVNIVDLGLVYDCRIEEEGEMVRALVKMTLTAPGCGMGPTIAADAQSRIMTLADIDDASVELVWDPPWTQDMISEEGRMMLGFA